MARFIEGYSPNTSSAKSAAQVVSAVKAAVKSTAQEVRKGIVGNTVSTNYPIGDRASTALGGAVSGNNTAKATSSVNAALSGYSGSGGSGSGTVIAAPSANVKDPYKALIQMIQDTTKANNEWSAAQAQKQMDFQERLSSTAHQREVADLQAAGLNPVLSAGGSGASTPSGAMGDTDTSGTRVIAEVAMEAIAAMANTAVGVAGGHGRAQADDDSFFGKLTNFYTHNKLGKKLIDTGLGLVTGLGSAAGKYSMIKAILR